MGKVIPKIRVWTAEEDKVFIDTLNDLVGGQSYTLNKALDVVAEKLKRPKAGCAFRYNKTIREQLDSALLDKISANNPANYHMKVQPTGTTQQTLFDIEGFEEISDFSKVNLLKEELTSIDSQIKALQARKTTIVDELKVYLDNIASLINSTK